MDILIFKVINVGSCLFHIIQWNNRYVIVADSNNKTFKIINIDNKNISNIHAQHTQEVICIKKINHPKYGESLLSAANDNTIKLWSI